jgi:UDP-N-acetyl-D-mannosaminuronate dehydrogenase
MSFALRLLHNARIAGLHSGRDAIGEVEATELTAGKLRFSVDFLERQGCNVHIVAAPTPAADGRL